MDQTQALGSLNLTALHSDATLNAHSMVTLNRVLMTYDTDNHKLSQVKHGQT